MSEKPICTVMAVALAMWLTGKLWRKEFQNHPSGERSYIYGLPGQRPPKTPDTTE